MSSMSLKFELSRTTRLIMLLEPELRLKNLPSTLLLYVVQQLLLNSTRLVRDSDITWREATNYVVAGIAIIRLHIGTTATAIVPLQKTLDIGVPELLANIPDLSALRTIGGVSDEAIGEAHAAIIREVIAKTGNDMTLNVMYLAIIQQFK